MCENNSLHNGQSNQLYGNFYCDNMMFCPTMIYWVCKIAQLLIKVSYLVLLQVSIFLGKLQKENVEKSCLLELWREICYFLQLWALSSAILLMKRASFPFSISYFYNLKIDWRQTIISRVKTLWPCAQESGQKICSFTSVWIRVNMPYVLFQGYFCPHIVITCQKSGLYTFKQ